MDPEFEKELIEFVNLPIDGDVSAAESLQDTFGKTIKTLKNAFLVCADIVAHSFHGDDTTEMSVAQFVDTNLGLSFLDSFDIDNHMPSNCLVSDVKTCKALMDVSGRTVTDNDPLPKICQQQGVLASKLNSKLQHKAIDLERLLRQD